MTERVLIVDDEEGILDVLAMRLEDEGLECVTTPNGTQAWCLIRADPPGVVLLDIVLPGSSGWDVAEHMLANPATATIPFVIVTAVDDAAAELRGLQLGAFEFLVKPFDTDAVLRVVRSALSGQPVMTQTDRLRRIEALRAV